MYNNMRNKISISTLFVATILLLCGCNESYISPEYPTHYENTDFESVIDSVPIVIAMSDPNYTTITPTRGMGAIVSDIPENRESATFYVHSFLTNNYKYNREIDYRKKYKKEQKEGEVIQCLIGDPDSYKGVPTQLMTNDLLKFTDTNENYFYNQNDKEYKYNFFAYHIDDAEIIGDGIVAEKDKIRMDIRIDGTQDIIGSVADITDKQLQNLDQDKDKLIFANILNKELLYSTLTGHRSIIPVFKAKHHFVRFVFNMVGESNNSDSIFIHDLYVMANRDLRFTVAADDFNKLGVEKINEKKLEEIHLCDDKDDDGGVASLERYKYSVKPQDKLENLGLGLLLPEREKYDLYINCAIKKNDDTYLDFRVKYELKNIPFEAGKQYNITLHIYGYQNIKLRMDGLNWKIESEDIPIDEDDLK